MATITLRAVKGSPLTNSEVDENFTNINNELAGKLTANQTITLSGDVTGSGGTAITATLANSGVTAGTYTKVTVDAKGRVTSGGLLASADLPTYTGSITSSQVTTALGYTPSQRGNFATSPEASVDAADIRNLTNPTTGLGYAAGVRFRFSSLNDDSASPFADVIDLSTYGDASGGGVNALYLGKNSQVIQHKYAAAGGTSWTTKTIAYTDSNITGSAATLTTGRTIGMTGDVTWTSGAFNGSANVTGTATLANSGVTAGTYTKVTVDAKGRVTSGGSLASADLPTYTGSITSSQVTTALGYTPYNSTNPAGYITSSGSITGNAATATAATYLNGGASSANQANITSRVNSGFWESDTGTMGEGWPVNSNTWQHLISSTHSNNDNYFALQLAAPFYDQALYYRSTNGSGTTAWSKVTLDTSVNRPGPTRLYRREEDSNYSVQTYWNGSHWVLDGYSGDTWHAGCRVARANAADTLVNSSGSAPHYSCRAWVNFFGRGSVGTNQTIRASGNVSSVYKSATGRFTINFVTAMPDANYAVGATVKEYDATNTTSVVPFIGAQKTLANSMNAAWFELNSIAAGSGYFDCAYAGAAVFR